MRKFRVPIAFVGYTTVTVEANDLESAEFEAMELAPQNSFGFAEYDADEWYVDGEIDEIDEEGNVINEEDS